MIHTATNSIKNLGRSFLGIFDSMFHGRSTLRMSAKIRCPASCSPNAATARKRKFEASLTGPAACSKDRHDFRHAIVHTEIDAKGKKQIGVHQILSRASHGFVLTMQVGVQSCRRHKVGYSRSRLLYFSSTVVSSIALRFSQIHVSGRTKDWFSRTSLVGTVIRH